MLCRPAEVLPRRAASWLAVLVLIAAAAPSFAQGQGQPGPYVFDVRGSTSSLPPTPGFYPPLPLSTIIPSRGFGIDGGAHVYFGRLGPARIGVGASLIRVRGTAPAASIGTQSASSGIATAMAPAVRMLLTAVAPQLSFNFGTGAGWSYLSGGLGVGEIATVAVAGGTESTKTSGWRRAINLGGGARWFIKPRLAVGFDIRIHRLLRGPVTPQASPLAISAGLSLR